MTVSLSILRPGLLAWALAVSALPLQAGPGAHGPNGEHLDSPAPATTRTGTRPRFEARTEAFEMVGRLEGGELALFINRFETNEPVLGAQVELESGALKVKAPFLAGHGTYSVADAAFLKALAEPGPHPLVITVVAGNDADLLEATLTGAAPGAAAATERGQGQGGEPRPASGPWGSVAIGLGAVAAAAAIGWFAIRRRHAGKTSIGASL